MADQDTKRPAPSLRFWQAGALLTKTAGVADAFLTLLQGWLDRTSLVVDADTAPIKLVELLGWGRNVDRFAGEDDTLFRKRVKYALANAKDAGSRAGFERIWARLGLGAVGQNERFDETDWDVIRLQINEEVFGNYSYLFDALITAYGRTCRRYELETFITSPAYVGGYAVACDCMFAVVEE